jgi:hypothetical protein
VIVLVICRQQRNTPFPPEVLHCRVTSWSEMPGRHSGEWRDSKAPSRAARDPDYHSRRCAGRVGDERPFP